MSDCMLCGELDGELARGACWRVVVNHNQDRLGKCFLVLDRHEEDVANLTERELSDLWTCLRRVKAAITTLFQPDHFNYLFLMNQDAHVHLHVVPRYRTPRAFAGIDFTVIDSLDGGDLRLPAEVFAELVAAIGERLAGARLELRPHAEDDNLAAPRGVDGGGSGA